MVQQAPLPVTVAMRDAGLEMQVIRYVESSLNWQVIAEHSPLKAQLVITDDPSYQGVCILVSPEPYRGALPDNILGSIVWPGDAALLATFAPSEAQGPPITYAVVSSTAPGTGARTASVLLGAIGAWAGYDAVLPGSPYLLNMMGMEMYGQHPKLERLSCVDPTFGIPDQANLAIIPSPLGASTQVLVARPDHILLEALQTRIPPVILLVGRGPYRPDELRRIPGMTELYDVNYSLRLALAARNGALPHGVPGGILKPFRRIASSLWGLS